MALSRGVVSAMRIPRFGSLALTSHRPVLCLSGSVVPRPVQMVARLGNACRIEASQGFSTAGPCRVAWRTRVGGGGGGRAVPVRKAVPVQLRHCTRRSATAPEGVAVVLAAVARPLIQLWIRMISRAWRSGQFKGDAGSKYFRRLVMWPLAGVIGGLSVFGASSLDRQPDTGRLRLMCVSRAHELALGEESVATVLKNEGSLELSPDDEVSQHVSKVVNKVIAAAATTTKADLRDVKWRTHVIKSGAKNAFVLPTGDIFVYTGMLELCDNSDQLAFVVAHEVAHVLGRHAAEKIGFAIIAMFVVDVLRPYHSFGGGDLVAEFASAMASAAARVLVATLGALAYSRALETEADRLGQLTAARAGYDPREAKNVYKNFLKQSEEKDNVGAREYLSTHPSHAHRISNLERWEAECERERWTALGGTPQPTKAQEEEWKREKVVDRREMARSRKRHDEWSTETWYSDPTAIRQSFEVARLASALVTGVVGPTEAVAVDQGSR